MRKLVNESIPSFTEMKGLMNHKMKIRYSSSTQRVFAVVILSLLAIPVLSLFF